MRYGKGAQRLSRHPPLVGENGQFTTPGCDYLTVHEDLVTEINEFLPGVEGLLTDLVEGQHGLDFDSITASQRRKAQLARVSGEDDSAHDPDVFPRSGVGFEISVGGTNSSDVMGDRQLHRIRIHATALELFALGATNPHLLREVVLDVGAVHDGQGYWIPACA